MIKNKNERLTMSQTEIYTQHNIGSARANIGKNLRGKFHTISIA